MASAVVTLGQKYTKFPHRHARIWRNKNDGAVLNLLIRHFALESHGGRFRLEPGGSLKN
jgi:hypothetical protein